MVQDGQASVSIFAEYSCSALFIWKLLAYDANGINDAVAKLVFPGNRYSNLGFFNKHFGLLIGGLQKTYKNWIQSTWWLWYSFLVWYNPHGLHATCKTKMLYESDWGTYCSKTWINWAFIRSHVQVMGPDRYTARDLQRHLSFPCDLVLNLCHIIVSD